jgi:short-subunit dehydrogenase
MKVSRKKFEAYGSWAVVTGASSGIGQEIALKLAAVGLNIVLVARREAALQDVARQLHQKYQTETKVIAADLGQKEGVEKVQAGTADLNVGLLVAAAGFGTSGKFLEAPLEEELNMLDVNCRALTMLSWHFGQRFKALGRGGIILISSILGFQGTPNVAHYAATKAYVQTLGEALHLELAPLGVDLLVSAPGPTRSGFASRAGMKMDMTLDAADVAEFTLNALGRRATVLPGALSKLLVYSLHPLPKWAKIRIMGKLMDGMITS